MAYEGVRRGVLCLKKKARAYVSNVGMKLFMFNYDDTKKPRRGLFGDTTRNGMALDHGAQG